LGCILQRLFSTFPNSWPGVGLLLLRVGLGFRLTYTAIVDLSLKPSEPAQFAQNLIAIASSIFLAAGLWTPVIGGIVAVDEFWIALSRNFPQQEQFWIHLFLALLSVCVAMLGPGAWSIDAHLFGRKRFDIDRTKGRKPSP
jgi:uncharacterized membrane protein YphA (DoxX/SURF4 family)